MSDVLPDFKLLRPVTAGEAIAAFAGSKMPRYCAGGTDLMVNMRKGLVEVETLIDLTGLADMKRYDLDASGLYLGAGITLAQIAGDAALAKAYPAVVQAARTVAGPTHREAATVGGNLCLDTRCQYYNQSHWWRKSNAFCLKYKGNICHVAPTGNRCRAAFSGDLAPALMVHDAEIDILGPDGHRRLALADFYQEDGANPLLLKSAEIVMGIYLPATRAISAYEKIRIRGNMDFPLAGVAVACDKETAQSGQFKVAITGTNSCPVAVDMAAFDFETDTLDIYFEGFKKSVQKAVSPQRTTTTAAHYRRLSVAAMAARIARGLWES